MGMRFVSSALRTSIAVGTDSLTVLLQALSGFLMMMTQNGKLLYISDNAAEYLGHSMVSTRMRIK
jgi:uncharacterized protein with von Willebrand factor type A (vWA) domain